MKNLEYGQLQTLLSAISKLNSDIEPENLPERTIAAVSEIISSDIISFDGFSLSTDFLVAENWHNPPHAIPTHLLEILSENFAEHPFVSHIQNRRSNAVRISDCVTIKDFHSRVVFNEFYRKVNVTHQMSVCLPVETEGLMTCTINRDGIDFSESERDLYVSAFNCRN